MVERGDNGRNFNERGAGPINYLEVKYELLLYSSLVQIWNLSCFSDVLFY